MKKRCLATLLALAMCLTLLPAVALAADSDFTIDENGVLTKYNGPGGDVVIPEGVTSIGTGAFYRCATLTKATIPDGVTGIEALAFKDCTSLSNVTIPGSVTQIGDSAFSGCTSLTYMSIPNGVSRIGIYAFSYCDSLARVTIPNSVINIERGAFQGCIGLTCVNIPDGVTSIGENAFAQCDSLTSIEVAAGNAHYTAEDGVLFNKARTVLVAYPGGKFGTYTIPASVTKIGESAFSDCVGLTCVTIPESVTGIEDFAFSGCTGLTRVTIPERVTRIDRFIFSGCTGLTSVTIPGSAIWIENGAFDGCTSLTDVYFQGTQTQWDAITIGGGNDFLISASIHYETEIAKVAMTSASRTLSFSYTDTGRLILTEGELSQGEIILVAGYNKAGCMTEAKVLAAGHKTAQVDPSTPNVKLYWLGAAQQPQSASAAVWGK